MVTDRPKISVIQPGARLHYAMPAVFAEAGILRTLHTDLHADHTLLRTLDWAIPERVRTKALKRLLGRRLPDGLRRELVQDHPVTTAALHISAILGLPFGGPERMTSRLLADLEATQFEKGDIVYTVIVNEDVDVMSRLRDRGVRIIHECIIGPDVGLLLLEECERFPDLGPTPDRREVEAGRARDRLKYEVSDLILVPSKFTEKAVRELAPESAVIFRVPYGFDLTRFRRPNNPIPGRVLSVGTVGRRKGHPDLAAATRLLARKCSQVEVRVAGPVEGDILGHPAMQGPVYLGQVPRSAVVEEFAKADVFALPTICDSFGIAIIEAMAMGLPVVTTTHCGDIVRDGIDGFVVPIRDPETLAARIQEIIEDRELRERMSKAAVERANEFSQKAYASRLLRAVSQLNLEEREQNHLIDDFCERRPRR